MSRILKGYDNQITQSYKAATHKGIDIVGKTGKVADIIAHTAGTVTYCDTTYNTNRPGATGVASWGIRVIVQHANGYYTAYNHLANVAVKKGQKVTKGQLIGRMGNTGSAYGIHLHFEVMKGGAASTNRIDPTPYINADLPGNSTNGVHVTGEIKYKVYAHSKVKNRETWLGEVSSHANADYAGNKGFAISGIKAVPKNGEIFIESHIKGGSWLSKISSKNYSKTDSSSYSGVLGTPVDLVKITCTIGSVEYRVYDNVKGCFLPWVKNGAEAGIKGHSIGAIQIR